MWKRIERTLVALLTSVTLVCVPVAAEAARHGKSGKATTVKVAKAGKTAKASKLARKTEAGKSSKRFAKGKSRGRVEIARRSTPRVVATRRAERAEEPAVTRVAYAPSLSGDELDGPRLYANVALAYNEKTGEIAYSRNADRVVSIASITKLMTAMVVLDAKLDLDEVVTITDDDVVASEGSRSRLRVGYGLTRGELLKVALLVSDNRAAVALGRSYPGGMDAFVARMNRKAKSLGMADSGFVEPSGLNSGNQATPADLVRMVHAAYDYPLLRQISSTIEAEILPFGADTPLIFRNTNQLVRNPEWNIGITKTGFIREAGHCLVMQTQIANSPYVLIIMDSSNNRTRENDAARIKHWIEYKAGIYGSTS